jgi:general secretion pathway protein D
VISAGSTDTSVDQIFTLPVSIADASDLYAFQFDLAFDPSILQLLSISEGSFLPSAGSTIFIPGDIDNIGGNAISNADTLVGDIPGASGDGDLVDFTFQAIGPGATSLALSNGLLFDSNFNDIPFTTADGSVTVSGSPVPEPAGLSWIGCLAVTGMLLAKRWRRAGRRAVKISRSPPECT